MARTVRASKRRASQAPVGPTEAAPRIDLGLWKQFDALTKALDARGHDDAVDVLERVWAAVSHPDQWVDGQQHKVRGEMRPLTHADAVAKMATIARDRPTKKGAKGRREVHFHDRLIELVIANREKGRPDAEIADLLVHMWAGFFRDDADLKIALLDDAQAMAKLPHLDAGRFVRNVGIELGHADVMPTLTNRKHAAKYRKDPRTLKRKRGAI